MAIKEYQAAWRLKHQERLKVAGRKYYQEHKKERKACAKKYYQEHKEEHNANARKWHQRNREKSNATAKKYRQEHREEVLKKARVYRKANRERLNAKERERSRKKRPKLKLEVLAYYGLGVCQCVICGESRVDCLSIDHIANNGQEHRRTLTSRYKGSHFYKYLKDNGYPDGYQTLCMNCQWVKKAEHQHAQRI